MTRQRSNTSHGTPAVPPSRRRALALAAAVPLAVGSGMLGAPQASASPAGTDAAAVAAAWSSPTANPHATPVQKVRAFLHAGYTYDHAVVLARVWHTDPYSAKVTAGGKILRGIKLPIYPGQDGLDAWYIGEFFDAGFGYDDAVRLARVWHLDLTTTKLKAGHQIFDAIPLPGERPHYIDTFLTKGYDWADARTLARIWKVGPVGAKVKAGALVLSGQQDVVDGLLHG